jgi:hypothetical protein
VIATPVSWLRRWLPALLILTVPAVTRAETVLVLPASGAGISSQFIQSARALFVGRLAREDGRLTILDRERPPTTEPFDPAQALALGMYSQAQAVILFDLRREAGTTTLTVTGLGVPAGERLFQYRQGTTAGPEVMPSLIEGAVAAVFSRQGGGGPAGCPPTTPPPPRQTFFGARAGGRAPFNKAGDTDRAIFGMGLFLVKEFSRLFVDIGFTHNSADRGDNDDRGNATAFGLGLYLPFTPESTAPYLGASLRWQHSRFGGQGADGFVITPALGWSWRRKESLGLRVEGGVFYNLYEERALDRLVPGAAQPFRSWGIDLWVATWL